LVNLPVTGTGNDNEDILSLPAKGAPDVDWVSTVSEKSERQDNGPGRITGPTHCCLIK
jgi:hypothetical protein